MFARTISVRAVKCDDSESRSVILGKVLPERKTLDQSIKRSHDRARLFARSRERVTLSALQRDEYESAESMNDERADFAGLLVPRNRDEIVEKKVEFSHRFQRR